MGWLESPIVGKRGWTHAAGHDPGEADHTSLQPWKSVDDVELATLSWVHWHNHDRLHGYLGDVPPAEFEQAFSATNGSDQTVVEIQ